MENFRRVELLLDTLGGPHLDSGIILPFGAFLPIENTMTLLKILAASLGIQE